MSHTRINERSLAFGRLIADRLRENPSLVRRAWENLDRWATTCGPQAAAALGEWRHLLAGPPELVLDLLTATDDRAVRLRQSNPFAGVLTPQERNAVLRRFHAHDPVPA